MWKRLSRVASGRISSSSSDLSGLSADPRVKVILRSRTPFPGDRFDGLVYLYLPSNGEILLVEVVIVGTEQARIGVLSGRANFEMRKTTYYQQYLTVLGAVPPAVMAAREKAAAKNAASNEDRKRKEMRRGSMNKAAWMQAANASHNGSHRMSVDGNCVDGDGEMGDTASDQQTLLYAPTTVGDDQIVRLAAGTYTFPFSLQLPDILPPSGSIVKGHEARCEMTYRVKCRVLFRKGKQLHVECPFTLRMLPVQLQRWLQLHRPADAQPSFPVAALAPGAAAESEASPGYDTALGNVDNDADETASQQSKSPKAVTAAARGGGMSDDYNQTQRHCIDHQLCFSREQLEREDAEYVAAAAAAKDRRANEDGKSEESSSGSCSESDEDERDKCTPFLAQENDGSGAANRIKTGKNASGTKGSAEKTRMLISEIDKIGFAETAEEEESDAFDEHQRRLHHRHHERRQSRTIESDKPQDRNAARQQRDADATKAQDRGKAVGKEETAEADPNDADGDALADEDRNRANKAAAEQDGSNNNEEAGEGGDIEAEHASTAPPSRTLREPIWDEVFTLPLRGGLVTKGVVGVHLILHANVLRRGRDTVRFSAIIDNTQGGGPITKARFSLIVREMIRSKTETYPFFRVETEETVQTTVAKGKIARLPLMEIPMPDSVPPTLFTEGSYSRTFLNMRLFSATALKTYSRSAEVELLVVNDTDTRNQSRRLLHWTNYYAGRGLKGGATSAPTIDFNSVNLHPQTADANAVADAEEDAAADIAESVMGDDRYTASVGVSARALSIDPLSPSLASASSVRLAGMGPLSPSSTALEVFQHSQRSEHSPKRKKDADASGAGGDSNRLASHVRHRLNFTEATFLPLAAVQGLAGGGGPTGHLDPMAGVNPLMAPPKEA